MKTKKLSKEKEIKNQKLANFIMKLHKEKLDTERTLCRLLHYEEEYNLSEFLSFFQNGHLLFCVLLEFTQKTGGYPPSLRKEICKLFVNGCEKSYCTQNAIALEEKYRVL